MAEANGPDVFEQQQEAIIHRPDSRPLLASIKIPTLIIVGEGDQITPPEVAEEMHAGIAGSKLLVVPRGGHLALLEQPRTPFTRRCGSGPRPDLTIRLKLTRSQPRSGSVPASLAALDYSGRSPCRPRCVLSSTSRFWRLAALMLFIAPVLAACAGTGVGSSGVKRAAFTSKEFGVKRLAARHQDEISRRAAAGG